MGTDKALLPTMTHKLVVMMVVFKDIDLDIVHGRLGKKIAPHLPVPFEKSGVMGYGNKEIARIVLASI